VVMLLWGWCCGDGRVAVAMVVLLWQW
jgi:hypothetical protein